MMRFEVLEAENISHACALLAEHKGEARIIAGGQNLLVLLRQRAIRPRYLISIKKCSELEYISEEKDSLKIGALALHSAVENSGLVAKTIPMLAELEHEVGCLQSRNWGTLGGNICQASPTSDLAPALIALEARCLVKSQEGERIIPMENFFIEYQKTALAPDEVLIEIQVPKPEPGTGGIHRKESVRFADPAIASVSVVVKLGTQGVVKEARIILQAVCPTPLRASEAEQAIIGEKIDDSLLDKAAVLAAGMACPISDVYGSEAYKREMVRVLTRSNLREAIKRAQAS